MKKMIVFLLIMAAPLMAQHATQFAYYATTSCEIIPFPGETSSSTADSPESGPANPFTAIVWDPDTQVSTEGFSLEGDAKVELLCGPQGQITGPNTIHIHHAGWYLAKFLITANSPTLRGEFRFGLLNLEDLTIIPFSVYGVEVSDVFEQLAGQVVFYVPANTRIQLVNDGTTDVALGPTLPPLNTTFLASIYLFELLGR